METISKQQITVVLAVALLLSLIGNVYFVTKPAPEVEDVPDPIITPPYDVETLIFAEQIDDITNIGDPAVIGSGNSLSWAHWMYDGLVIFKGLDMGNPQPRLAESWTMSPNGLVWTFKLVRNAYFDTGNEFTAKDVVYSFQRHFWLKSRYMPLLKGIGMTEDSWTIIDDYTVQLNLDFQVSPDLVFDKLYRAEYGILDSEELPNHYLADDYGSSYLVAHTAGMSRFTYEKIEFGSEVIMKVNPDYWRYKLGIDELPSIKRIIWLNVQETSVARMMLEKGEIDVAGQLSRRDAFELSQRQGYYLEEWGYKNIRMLLMNTLKEPFDDPKVRQAVKWCLDYDSYIKDIYYGLAEPLQTLLHQQNRGYLAELPYSRNITKAKELLAEAGYPDGFSATILTSATSTGEIELATKIIEDVKAAGINFDIELVTGAERSAAQGAQELDMRCSVWGYENDPSDAMDQFYCYAEDQPGHNYAWSMGWYRPDVAEMMDEALEELDWNTRKAIYHEIERIMLTDGPFAMIAKVPGNFVCRDWVENLTPTTHWYFEPEDVYKSWYPPDIS